LGPFASFEENEVLLKIVPGVVNVKLFSFYRCWLCGKISQSLVPDDHFWANWQRLCLAIIVWWDKHCSLYKFIFEDHFVQHMNIAII